MQRPNWDDLRLFLAVARSGRLLAAGQALGLDHSTVARRMTALEGQTGARLLNRSPRGVALTAAGDLLLAHAERMEAEWTGAVDALGEQTGGSAGVVRLATPEVFGTFMVAANVHRLRERHPGLELELVPESRTVSLSKREADVAIALNRPPRGRVVAQRLVDYRIGLFASRAYLEAKQPIRSIEDLRRHPIAWYIDELIDVPELRYFNQLAAECRSVFRSSSVAAQHAAVVNGMGIGILHAFAAAQDPHLVRILPEAEVIRSYWLLLHTDQRRLPRIRALGEFLQELVQDNRTIF